MQATLTRGNFRDALLTETDFIGANLDGAAFTGTDLRSCLFDGASLVGATLAKCNLEGKTLARPKFDYADFTAALLTGSRMHDGRFRHADFTSAGLADIDWENADLRDAEFIGASFHLGSTRCGMVGSTIASEGTRTGFYNDDYDDRERRPPEEIRKANLCGADLRGASVTGTDWYLVDLRDATYDDDQADHFRRCGAIL